MALLKFSENLFLGSKELQRLKEFLDDDGWRQHFLFNSSSFGLVKKDNIFTNFQIQLGTNPNTIKNLEIR